MRLLTALCVAIALACFAVPAYAETQNVKVSGDIGISNVYQHHIDLCDSGAAANENDNENFFIQQVGLNVEADLTDNVSTFVRLLNERAWDAESDTGSNDFEVLLDEAYVTLKEMLYAPLTVRLGRQNIWLGKGFVIGNAGLTVWDSGDLPTTIQEVSDMTAFDAIKATLDYDPWTITLIYSKMDENATNMTDDVDLYVANVGYKFTKYDAEAEVYWALKHDKVLRAGTSLLATEGKANEVNTIGLRGSFVPFQNMNVWGEGALQCGKYASTSFSSDREGRALNLGADYLFTDVKWTPKIGAEYTYLSGEKEKTDGTPDGDWAAWDAMYTGKFDTYIADFRNLTKPTQFDGAIADTTLNNTGVTNENKIGAFGSINPMTDVKVEARYTYLWYDETPSSTATPNRDEEIGSELDAKLTYDYTEDVAVKVAGGVFWAGDYFKSGGTTEQNATAGQVLTAVTVDF